MHGVMVSSREYGWRSSDACGMNRSLRGISYAACPSRALGLWLLVQVVFVELDGRRARLTEGNLALAAKLNRVDLKEHLAPCGPVVAGK